MLLDRRLIEAKLCLGEFQPGEWIPIAWNALEAGYDGRWIRRLAAYDFINSWELEAVLPGALDELHIERITPELAYARLAKQIVIDHLEAGHDPLLVRADQLWKLWVKAGHPALLGVLGTLWDEIYLKQIQVGDEETREWLRVLLEAAASYQVY